jgi:hypothetical protein
MSASPPLNPRRQTRRITTPSSPEIDLETRFDLIDQMFHPHNPPPSINLEVNLEEEATSELSPDDQDDSILPPLEIEPLSKINNSDYTYANIVTLLSPSINNVKLPISKMEVHKWYRISTLGNTLLETWQQVGLTIEPNKEVLFKCIYVPPETEGEAIVYESTPACMAVHELSRQLDYDTIIETFQQIIGEEKIDAELSLPIYLNKSVEGNQSILHYVAKEFYKMIVSLLHKHNSNETEDSWTHVFDSYDKRLLLAKHAIFHTEEGIMFHPKFGNGSDDVDASELLIIKMFIQALPIQIQLAWAQNYMNEFITGYGQSLETFDPTLVGDMGFIASCINGNLEKILLSIIPAITYFYKNERPAVETPEERAQMLINSLTGSEFQNYFGSVEDVEGPTIEGYKHYILENKTINEERKTRYLDLLNKENPNNVISIIENIIHTMSGGAMKFWRKNKTQQHNHIKKSRRKLNKSNKSKKINRRITRKVFKKKHITKHTKKAVVKKM